MEAPAMPRLVLEVAETKVELPAGQDLIDSADAANCALQLGKSADNDLIYESPQTSRFHARIEYKNNDFYLVDCSTNGTYVQTEDEAVTRVHRNRIRLWGSGWLSLGQPLSVAEPIHFRQLDRS
ncbi:MAG: FHA domain-containing protein [Pseudomonadota bacterium]